MPVFVSLLPHPAPSSQLYLNSKFIPAKTAVRDLGVKVDRSLKFYSHIMGIVARAKQRILVLFKCFRIRSRYFLLRACNVYVRSLLDYDAIIWSPFNIQLTNRLESVQKYFTRRLLHQCVKPQIPTDLPY